MIVFHFNITNSVLYEIEVLHDVRYDELLPLFREALDEWRGRAPGYRYRASALLYKVFAIIRAELGPKSERLSQPIAAAVRHIAENYSDSSLSVESLAQSVHMSDTWFRKHFRQETEEVHNRPASRARAVAVERRLRHGRGGRREGRFPRREEFLDRVQEEVRLFAVESERGFLVVMRAETLPPSPNLFKHWICFKH